MHSWQTVVVCVALTVVSREAWGHPRALEDSVLGQVKEDVGEKQPWFLVENNSKKPEEEPTKISRSASQEEEEARKVNLMKDDQLRIPREFLVANTDEKKDELVETTKVDAGPEVKVQQKDDDTVRSKKSPDMRELTYHTHPMTSVCIQVRSDHRPSVVCGPQVEEDKHEEKTTPSAARFSSGDVYIPRGYYPEIRGGQSQSPLPQNQPLYMRMSPEDIERYNAAPSKATGKQIQKGTISPQKMTPGMPPVRPVMSAKAARGPPFGIMRTQPEDDNTLKQPEGTQPAVPVQPLRIVPQSSLPSSLVIHKQLYQAAPIPQYNSNFIPSVQSATPLRFNCALQPDGAQFVQTYGSPLRSSSSAGLLPLGENVMITDAQGIANMQGYYLNPQGRAAQPDEMLEYGDPWVGTTFVGEDGQLYQIDDSQARSAADGEETLRGSNTGLSMEDLHSKYTRQEEELKKSSEKISQLDKKLKEMQRAVAEEGDKKKPTMPAEPSKDVLPTREPSEVEEHKPMQNKNTKRHSFH